MRAVLSGRGCESVQLLFRELTGRHGSNRRDGTSIASRATHWRHDVPIRERTWRASSGTGTSDP
jgi:hypothetical protein